MRRIGSFAGALLSAALFALQPAASPPALAATSPDFSTVADILQGRRTLLPVDDIVVTQGLVQSSSVNPTITIFETEADAIGAHHTYSPAGEGVRDLRNSAYVSISGRLFNLPNDVVLTIASFGDYSAANLINFDQSVPFNQTFPIEPGISSGNVASPSYALTDLTGDGFDDVVVSAGDGLLPLTAADVNDLSQGLFYGTRLSPSSSDPTAMAGGDFDGDGVNEVALAYWGSSGVNVGIYKPQVTHDSAGKVTALSLVAVGSTVIPVAAGRSQSAYSLVLSKGLYSGAPNPQLLLVYRDASNNITAQPFVVQSVENSPQVTIELAKSAPLGQIYEGWLALRSGHLAFYDTTEQAVLMVQVWGVSGQLYVLSLDSELNLSVASTLSVPLANNMLGPPAFALGNFDQPIADNTPLNLEIAAVFPCRSAAVGSTLQIYHVDVSNNFALSPGSSAPVDLACNSFPLAGSVRLETGDLQGRGLVLGAPSKLTAQHNQPHLILGAPPMHLDYVTPGGGAAAEVLNLSGIPHGFYSNYQTSVSKTKQSSHQGTTSYTNAEKADISAGYKFWLAALGSVTVQAGASAGHMRNHFIDKQHGSYTTASFDASTSTGFDDQVWYSSETHNIYIYPVIGQVVCPAENPGCVVAEKKPLQVVFSGPSQIKQYSVGGSALEWYQPVHEVGNLFSYPGSFQQLQAIEGEIDLLSSASPTSFSTDSSTYTATADWSGGSQQSKTSGVVSNISWGASASITKKPSLFGGSLFSAGFSYNGSKAISTIYTSTTKIGESTGIGISKPGTFPNPDLYEYPIWPYIFGDKPTAEPVQNIDIGTDVQTQGILRAGYIADPTNSNAGAWWKEAYTLPDVAVAHAARWSFQLYAPSSPQPNCIPIANTSRNQDCAIFNAAQADIWSSEFYWMKGLLITPADADGEGPQISGATAGAKINLQARVYNLSLTGITDSIKVQFYGQPWNPNTLQPDGNAFLIDEIAVPPLPGFHSASEDAGGKPNWTVAQVTLDTTAYPDTYLAFWVVVFIPDGQGGLVPEMPGHGLTLQPPILTSIADAAPYLQPYSNNIGLYKSLFYVSAPNGEAVSALPSRLGLQDVKVSASEVLRGQRVTVSGRLDSLDGPYDGLSVVFYDGKPNKNGRVFDVEDIAHIRADGTHLVKTVYHADSCGKHTLYLRVVGQPKVRGKTSVRVRCPRETGVKPGAGRAVAGSKAVRW